MRTLMKEIKAGGAVLLATSLVAGPLAAAEKIKPTPEGKQWRMKYDSGERVRVFVGSEKILVFSEEDEPEIAIAVEAISEVAYDADTQRRSAPVWDAFKESLAAMAEPWVAFYQAADYQQKKVEYERALTDYWHALETARRQKADYSHFFIGLSPEAVAYFGPFVVASLKTGMRVERAREALLERQRTLDEEDGASFGRGQDARELAFAATVLGAAAAVLAPFKTTKHFVEIWWEEDGEARSVVFKVGKGEYRGFLADLQRVTGKPWEDLASQHAQQREALRDEMEQEPPAPTGARSPEGETRAHAASPPPVLPGLREDIAVEGRNAFVTYLTTHASPTLKLRAANSLAAGIDPCQRAPYLCVQPATPTEQASASGGEQ